MTRSMLVSELRTKGVQERTATPNDRSRYQVMRDELPLHCPLPRMSLWNSHPQVYLPIEATGEAKCPYCGTEFVLVER